MHHVYVVDKKGRPLMPTIRFGHVRKLLKEGKAVQVSHNPFTIRLKYDVPGYTQSVHLGIDTGRENIGTAASLEDGTNVYLADIQTSNKSIKKNMQERALFRSARRRHDRQSKQRKAKRDGTEIQKGDVDVVRTTHPCRSKKVTYPGAEKPVTHKVIQGKEGKFHNRQRSEGWITPSGRQIIQVTMSEIRQAAKILPITHICLERVTFDFQKLENEDITRWEYGRGPLYGYKSYKEYIWDEQHGRCACCEKPITQYHHITPRAAGGVDNVKNIIGLCNACHDEIHRWAEAEEKLKEKKAGIALKYQIGLLNSVIPSLIDEVSAYCKKRNLAFTVTDGRATAQTRREYGLQKDHCIDGYAVSLAGRAVRKENVVAADTICLKRRFKKKSKNIIHALNQRVYKLDGKIVAYNRHKAMDQKDDSLEEFMAAYASSHSEKECGQLMHQLEILPARRTYTYHKMGLVAPIRPGDIVQYRKVNKIKGNTKTMVFLAASVKYKESTFTKKGTSWTEGEWVVRGTKKDQERKGKFCRPIQSGCLQAIGVAATKDFLTKAII